MIRNIRTRGAFVCAVFTLLLMAPCASARAASSTRTPQCVILGFAAYKTDGADAAVKTWLKGGPFEGSKEAMGQAKIFQQIEALFGKYTGYETLYVKDIGSSAKLVYESINFEKGAAYARFLLYNSPAKEWIISNMDFNTKPDVILPKSLIE